MTKILSAPGPAVSSIVTESTNQACFTWGKSSLGNPLRHSALPAHTLAVAATFEALLEMPLVHKALCAAWGLESLPSRSILVWCAALHDLGKAHPRFQRKRMDILRWISAHRNTPEPREIDSSAEFDHAVEGGQRIWPFVEATLKKSGVLDTKSWQRTSLRVLRGLMMGAFAHHGQHGAPVDQSGDAILYARDGIDLATGMAEVAIGRHGPFAAMPYPRQPVVLAHLFAGWVALADWIGSDERIFPFIDCINFAEDHPTSREWGVLYEQYLDRARRRVSRLGLSMVGDVTRWQPAVMQGLIMNAVQTAARDAAARLANGGGGGGLVIIEAPMGCGKTEASLLAAGAWIGAEKAIGVAFGLPAQASANMIVRRMKELSLSVYGVQPNLAHANATFVRHRMQETMFTDGGDREAGTHLDQWITDQGKRAFLAPLCAATVDQIELAAMHSKHGFVRMAALSRQVVIIDEVHAYDAYMRHIIANLLRMLAAAHIPVVLLSATLPVSMRCVLAGAYAEGLGMQAPRAQDLSSAAYPLITSLGGKGGIESVAVPWAYPQRQVRIESFDDSIVTRRVLEAERRGECVAVMCNTVCSARDRFRSLRRVDPSIKITLLHSRLRNEDRTLRQEFIERLAGRGSLSAGRAGQIIVATQVLEQSIDIDVDFMLSEPAPADLLLQRMGRLHRHERPDRQCSPVFGVIYPDDLGAKTGPRWWTSSLRKIYAEGGKLLASLRLFLSIAGGDSPYISLPDDIPRIVAAIYGDEGHEEMTVEEAKKDALASDVVLDLATPMDQVGRCGTQSNATRFIEEVSTQVLLVVVDPVSGAWSIPAADGDHPMPERMSGDGKRVSVGFLGMAQRWQLPVRISAGSDDPDSMFTRTPAFAAAYEKSQEVGYELPFVAVPCVVISRAGERLRLGLGVTPTGQNIYYDNEEGIING